MNSSHGYAIQSWIKLGIEILDRNRSFSQAAVIFDPVQTAPSNVPGFDLVIAGRL
jgi:hypothetical protein